MSDNNYMEDICLITPENMSHFTPFLLSNARVLIGAGEPVVGLGYVKDDTACAAVCGYVVGQHFEIISFYVAPDFRRQGIGRALLDALVEMTAPFAGMISVDLVISAEEHEVLCEMLEKYGFSRVLDAGRSVYGTTIGKLLDSGLFMRDYGDDLLPSFSEVDDNILADAQRQAQKMGLPIPEKGFLSPTVDKKSSIIYTQSDGLKAYIAIEKTGDGSLLVSGVANCMNTPTYLMKALHDAVMRAMDIYPDETRVLMQTINDTSKKLLDTVGVETEELGRHFELVIKKTKAGDAK
ncbi:MAG: GNAT family N-acetyltransferase [Lachnospiraceae bacterium]|nr:GNAT family N-acetyltransferase [Lachnospiraceae bacterium]